MHITEAMGILRLAVKSECQDHTFGDAEASWDIDDQQVAEGYFSRDVNEVIVQGKHSFTGVDARRLRPVFASMVVERNDQG